MEIFKFFVGRERKGQAAFSPLVLLRGSEGVEKPERKDDRKRAGEGRPLGRNGVEDFQLPQRCGFIVYESD